MEFNILSQFDKEKNAWLIKITGEIDIYNSDEVKTRLTRLLEEKNTDLIIDCKDLEYIDSTGLGALVGVLKALKQADNNMHLKNLRSNILKLFRITDLDKVFIIEEVS